MSFKPVLNTRSTKAIKGFCDFFLKKYRQNRIRNPELLAMELRDFLGIPGHLNFGSIKYVALEKLGIADILESWDITNGNGLYTKFGESVIVNIRAQDSEQAKAFTIAHEIREIIGSFFSDLKPKFVDAKGDDLEAEADAFASTFLLGKDAFTWDTKETGYDILLLSRMYNRSFTTTVRRIVRNLSNQWDDPPFWCTIYKLDKIPQRNLLYTVGSFRNPSFTRKSRAQSPNLLFPKKGQVILLSGYNRQALNYKRSVYIEKSTGLDYWGDFNLSVIIRPYGLRESITGLIVVALPYEYSGILRKQILRARPIVLESTFQF